MDARSYSMGLSMPMLAVSASAIVPDLEVVEDRVGEFDAGAPAAPVEQFDLHPRPERLDHAVDAPIFVNLLGRWLRR